MDSSGVHAIVNASARARQRGRRLVLAARPADVDRVFSLTGNADDVESGDVEPVEPSGARRSCDSDAEDGLVVSATAPVRGAAEIGPDRARDARPDRAHARLRRAARRARRSRDGWRGAGRLHWHDLVVLAITYTLTGLGITVGFHRLFTHRSFKTSRTVRALLAVLRLDGGRGAGDRVGRHPSQAPPLLRPRGRPAQPARRPGAGVARHAARAGPRPRRLDVPRQGHGQPRPLRQGPARRPRPALHQPHVPAVGRGRAGHPVRPRRRPDRLHRGRAHRAAVGRRGARAAPASRDLQHQLAVPLSSAGARSPPTTSRATSPGWPRSPSARPGTTTTTPSRPRPGTASAAGSSTLGAGSSAAWSAATWPGTSSGSAPATSRPSASPRAPDATGTPMTATQPATRPAAPRRTPVVVALGGNALRVRARATSPAQRRAVESIADLAADHDVVVTHGNAPQGSDRPPARAGPERRAAGPRGRRRAPAQRRRCRRAAHHPLAHGRGRARDLRRRWRARDRRRRRAARPPSTTTSRPRCSRPAWAPRPC